MPLCPFFSWIIYYTSSVKLWFSHYILYDLAILHTGKPTSSSRDPGHMPDALILGLNGHLCWEKKTSLKKRTYSSGKRIGKTNSRSVSVLPTALRKRNQKISMWRCSCAPVTRTVNLAVGRAGQASWGCLFSPPAWNFLQVLNSWPQLHFDLFFMPEIMGDQNCGSMLFSCVTKVHLSTLNMFLYLFFYGGQLAISPNSPGQLIISTSINIS